MEALIIVLEKKVNYGSFWAFSEKYNFVRLHCKALSSRPATFLSSQMLHSHRLLAHFASSSHRLPLSPLLRRHHTADSCSNFLLASGCRPVPLAAALRPLLLADLCGSAEATGDAIVSQGGPVELPSTVGYSIFAVNDNPTSLLVSTSVLLTGAISVFLFRSLRRRAKRAKEMVSFFPSIFILLRLFVGFFFFRF